MPSDNAAARALARVSPLGSDGFIARMNEKATELGSGSHALRRSVRPALGQRVVGVRHGPAHHVRVGGRSHRVDHADAGVHVPHRRAGRIITVHSTNQILRAGDVDVRGGKTGFISKAGYCLATLLRLPQGGPSLAVVVLGANSNAGRFWETRHLLALALRTRAALRPHHARRRSHAK